MIDAQTAVQKLNEHVFKGCKLQVRMATEASSAVDVNARLLIRNLSFQATDADLTKLFSPIGPITEAKVVRLIYFPMRKYVPNWIWWTNSLKI